jgi:hypothetical protein
VAEGSFFFRNVFLKPPTAGGASLLTYHHSPPFLKHRDTLTASLPGNTEQPAFAFDEITNRLPILWRKVNGVEAPQQNMDTPRA